MDKRLSTITAEENTDIDIVSVPSKNFTITLKVVIIWSDIDILILLVALTKENK